MMKSRDGEHRCAFTLRVVEPIEKMNATGTQSRDAYPQTTRIFRMRTSHPSRSFLVARLDKPNSFAALTQRLHNAVDAVSRQANNRVDLPAYKSLYQCIRGVHSSFPSLSVKRSIVRSGLLVEFKN